MKKFNASLADAQATDIVPVSPDDFDFDAFAAYAADLDERCASFWTRSSGVLVYRRMRAKGIYTYLCSDMQQSLHTQLGALKHSMLFAGDIPNFIEPWYGVGTIASAYGAEYIWIEQNAPAITPAFQSVDQLLAYECVPVATTAIGKHTLDMIDYFMEQTGGRVPVSMTDSQSPLNLVGHLIPLDIFFLDVLLEPEKIHALFDRLAELSIEFNDAQLKRIGSALASPGHGFPSSRVLRGFGMSDDNAIMISPEHYSELAAPSVVKICTPLGGPAFHSCGDWAAWIDAVLGTEGLVMADGAFSPETDPGASDRLEEFHRFANTGVILNARIVGDVETIRTQVKRLWTPGMRLIITTYCPTPEEQAESYEAVHEICC